MSAFRNMDRAEQILSLLYAYQAATLPIVGRDQADVQAKAAATFPAGTPYGFLLVDTAGNLIDMGAGTV